MNIPISRARLQFVRSSSSLDTATSKVGANTETVRRKRSSVALSQPAMVPHKEHLVLLRDENQINKAIPPSPLPPPFSRSSFRSLPGSQQHRQVGMRQVLQQGQLAVEVPLGLPRSILDGHLQHYGPGDLGVAVCQEALAHRTLEGREGRGIQCADWREERVNRNARTRWGFIVLMAARCWDCCGL